MAVQAQYPFYSFSGFNYAPYYRAPYYTAAAAAPAAPAAEVKSVQPMAYNYPYNTYAPYAAYGYAAPAYTANQYHSQDELGQASFGYSHPGQAAVNYRDAFGNQVGSYAYINPDGKEVRVSYVADSNGFRVLSNDLPVAPAAPEVAAAVLPVPVQDTPEVVEARRAFMYLYDMAKNGQIVAPIVSAADVPRPVEDTAEVAQAKIEHAQAWKAALAAAEAAGSRKKRQAAVQVAYDLQFPKSWSYSTNYHPVAAAAAAAIPYTYGGFPYAYSAPYAAAPYAAAHFVSQPQPVREATLSKTVLNPGHAVAYRVD